MNKELSDRLVQSTLSHVMIRLDRTRLSSLLDSLEIGGLEHYHFDDTKKYKISSDYLFQFYPKIMIRNDIIFPVARSHSFYISNENYLERICSDLRLTEILNAQVIRNKKNVWSLLATIESDEFECKGLWGNRKFIRPQLIIPGYENDKYVRSWEDSLTRSYATKNILYRILDFLKDKTGIKHE